ncbi:protein-glutamate methylesterase/protein-glutamine glutaminase [Mesorhizobium xinjiangense]|uniref:protein-glutamate methylesterase/protein-glutamine glutaminase n=1 Tax=Mesorhizobium xinjiangense TaxID=2678685 RepID=UPI0012EE52EB|nr:chemotaxis response regulator protein-glutamate methylesterase [Mesorhizobium xinjiangense]
MKPVRVLIIDDSPTMRKIIGFALNCHPDIEVVGEAPDPTAAFRMVDTLDPDVITLDIEMPRMNGLDFLKRVMKHRPRPVIMVSSLTIAGAAATIDALANGAFECIGKPSLKDDRSFEELTELVRAAGAARASERGRTPGRNEAALHQQMTRASERIIAIGASTGGVEALIAVLGDFPADCPPTVIVQHMPANFTRSFAERLDRICKPKVQEAVDREPARPGTIYIAPGGDAHLEVVRQGEGLACRLRARAPVSGHRPSVDVLMSSVAAAAGCDAVGVILTGMGRDGAEGMAQLARAGARTIGQDENTSLIYGMPRVAFEMGGVARQVPLNWIAREIFSVGVITREGAIPCHS